MMYFLDTNVRNGYKENTAHTCIKLGAATFITVQRGITQAFTSVSTETIWNINQNLHTDLCKIILTFHYTWVDNGANVWT